MVFLREDNIIENKVIQSFLQVPENKELYKQVIELNDENSLKELNKMFKDFFLEIRLLKYISTIIHNSVIEMDIRYRKKEQILVPYNEQLHDKETFEIVNDSRELNEFLEDGKMIGCLNVLTEKEKNILSLIYMKELKEGEIAMSLNISQQAVSKTKRRALQKIREMVRKDEKNETTSASKTNSRR